MKHCPCCKTDKPLSEYTKKGVDKLQSYCKPCARQKTNEYRRTKYSPDKKRASDLKFKYGITPEDYNRMFTAQGGCCFICERHQSEFKRKLAVDHCHKTHKVRGLLCDNCNTALGKLDDNIERLTRAISYLRKEDEDGLQSLSHSGMV